MVKRSRGLLSGRTRKLRGGRKLTVSDKVRQYKLGTRVIIALESCEDGRVPIPPRYRGRHGKILDKQGDSYIVSVRDGNATKKLVVSSIYLREAAQ